MRKVFQALSTFLNCWLKVVSWNTATPASVPIDTARKAFIGVPTWAVALNDGEVLMISLRISKKLS